MDATATRSRGRPRQFDEEAVLDALTTLFWRQGYEATSMADIVEASGLNKSSLYNTFGSKQQLFTRVLDRYIDFRMSMLAALIDDAGDGIAGLHAFLDMVRRETGTEMGEHGCFAVNTSAELGRTDDDVAEAGHTYRDRMRAALMAIVERASTHGDLDPASTEARADMLLTFMLGLSVAVRGGATTAEIDRLIGAAHTMVDSWRR